MKNILVCLLMAFSLCSFTKKKKKPEAAFAKRSFTTIVGKGWPNYFSDSRAKSVGPINLGVDYQASKRWSFGLQYSFCHVKTDVRKHRIYTFIDSAYKPTDSFLYQEKVTDHILMATADFCYLNKGRVCLNSGIGIGYVFDPTYSFRFPDGIDHSSQMNREQGFLAIRIRLINARVKIKKNFGVYGSVGYGIDGLLSLGALYTFTGKK